MTRDVATDHRRHQYIARRVGVMSAARLAQAGIDCGGSAAALGSGHLVRPSVAQPLAHFVHQADGVRVKLNGLADRDLVLPLQSEDAEKGICKRQSGRDFIRRHWRAGGVVGEFVGHVRPFRLTRLIASSNAASRSMRGVDVFHR